MTGQRTHRYLRLSLVGVVFALAVAVTVETIRTGELLPSISDYYYSAAGGVFSAALAAIAVALLALSGRDLESVLLDVAAIFAPLIAIVPTGFRSEPVVPDSVMPAVLNGVTTYLVVLGAVLVMAIVLTICGQIPWRRTIALGSVALVVGIGLAILTFAPGLREQFPFVGGINVHLVVTVCFFAVFAAIPIVNALPRTRDPGARPPSRALQVVYFVIPVAMVITLVLTVTIGIRLPDTPAVFIGEAVGLILFAVFWAVQTVERWDAADPPSLVAGS
ncbi:hypothetical protein [Microbacterium dauci]|uniref:DUF998 domain-containing protein n=1 Tax=Microbacterium dauci TaxID=3048008 RepID=A0ABT6ZB70_9MICO|nr:hypothetical protein [Microbacterium sp. LX3-4]MDJ1113410.1 hypothetical protein [Microbacterium sp. LX3-4]